MKKIKTKNKNNGFTLVELMVSITIFTVIMVISMGSILTIFDANKKSQSLRTVMDNLNYSLEAMTRTIRFGTDYHCNTNTGVITEPRDCNGSDTLVVGEDTTIRFVASSMAVKAPDTSGGPIVQRTVEYKLDISPLDGKGRIVRSIDGGPENPVTSSDVNITDLRFRVIGSTLYSEEPSDPDTSQPMVIITVGGFAGVKATTKSTFVLQTTVS